MLRSSRRRTHSKYDFSRAFKFLGSDLFKSEEFDSADFFEDDIVSSLIKIERLHLTQFYQKTMLVKLNIQYNMPWIGQHFVTI